MKIVTAETTVVEIPFELLGSGVGIMPTAWKSLEFCLIRLEDDRGNVGWGEGFGYFTVSATKAIIDRLILPTLIGSDIQDIRAWNLDVQRRIHMFGRYGVTIFAIGGVDMALWDLAAQRAGKPLHALLSDAPPRRDIPSYVSLVRYSEAALLLPVLQRAADEGFSAFKLHEIDLALIEEARRMVPDQRLCVDVNCGWSEDFIRQNHDRIAALDLDWIEEPVFPPEDFAALSRLRGNPASIGAGENWCTQHQFEAALAAGAVDVLQPSVTKLGGVSVFDTVARLATHHGVRLSPHSPYFGPGFYASLHLAAAFPQIEALEWNFVKPDAWLSDVLFLRDGGTLSVPDGPGLGFSPDMAVLHQYRRST